MCAHFAAAVVLVLAAVVWAPALAFHPDNVFRTEDVDVETLRNEALEMFNHGFESYMKHGFPHDELRPLSCGWSDQFKGLAVTLIDSLSTLAVLGRRDDFTFGVNYIVDRFAAPGYFNLDVNVSVFETNIRVLGGLLSAHVIASNRTIGAYIGNYSGALLPLCRDLGDRLMMAFHTPTGLPYGTVNLRHGVPTGETPSTCAACCATFSLEFGALSHLTGDDKYYNTAKLATHVLWGHRSTESGLLGTHIDVLQGHWVNQQTAGIGGDTDSTYEMLYKSGEVFDDDEYRAWFTDALSSIRSKLRVEGADYLHYVDVEFATGVKILTVRSLSAFWPGLEAMLGDHEAANKTIHSFARIIRTYGFLPEAVCLTHLEHGSRVVQALNGEQYRLGVAIDGYPLRPELLESIFHLYRRTRDPSLLKVALMMVQSIRTTRVPCGYAAVQGVLKLHHRLLDTMDSFFLAEVTKYLFLLFHDAAGRPHWALDGGWEFNTEAHLLPSRMTKPMMRSEEL